MRLLQCMIRTALEVHFHRNWIFNGEFKSQSGIQLSYRPTVATPNWMSPLLVALHVKICTDPVVWLNCVFLRTLPEILNDNNNTKGAAPPDAPPPPPPPALGDSMDSQPDFSFNLELSRNQQEQYGTQFAAPSVTIVGKFDNNGQDFCA